MTESVYRVLYYFPAKGSYRGHERDTIVDGRKIITLLVTIRFDNIFIIVGHFHSNIINFLHVIIQKCWQCNVALKIKQEPKPVGV